MRASPSTRSTSTHDLDKADAILRSEKPTHIVNFAAQSMVGESWKYPDQWMMTNVVSAVRLHERLRQYDFLDRYVHVTTPEVLRQYQRFHPGRHPVPAEHTLCGVTRRRVT